MPALSGAGPCACVPPRCQLHLVGPAGPRVAARGSILDAHLCPRFHLLRDAVPEAKPLAHSVPFHVKLRLRSRSSSSTLGAGIRATMRRWPRKAPASEHGFHSSASFAERVRLPVTADRARSPCRVSTSRVPSILRRRALAVYRGSARPRPIQCGAKRRHRPAGPQHAAKPPIHRGFNAFGTLDCGSSTKSSVWALLLMVRDLAMTA